MNIEVGMLLLIKELIQAELGKLIIIVRISTYRIYSNKRRGVNSFGAKSLGRRLLEGGGNWRAAFISRKYRYT